MHDQAKQLRERLFLREGMRRTRIVTITSGKGGVGKSNFTLNFALGLKAKGQKVMILDVDIGFANLDVLMGISPKHHLLDLLKPDKTVWDVVERGPDGLEFIAGGSGFTQLTQFDDADLSRFLGKISSLQGHVDTVLLDTGGGITNESLQFMLSADEVLLVTTPEPTAIMDAYAVIKMIHSYNPQMRIRMVINRVASEREGKQTADKLTLVARQFLGMEVETLGYIADDIRVAKAVKQQTPFFLLYPQTQASKSICSLVDAYLQKGTEGAQAQGEGMGGFLTRIKRWIRK
ncbi:MinD/ParA family protein [Brevibacillus massiliensis]|uniref:MinD/ParA family protein n=1 Tax=Brevibacillus massiliensis TaxID=1118054 RepID=UPI00031702D2|nr:MinD/ParA family protein [Brevibacillus massiliensis]